MKNCFYAVIAWMLLGSVATAQNGYTIYPIPFNPDPYNVGTSANVVQDDIYSSKIPLPFSFCFYDQSYDTILIGSNGVVTFDLAYENSYCNWVLSNPIPHATHPNLSIMAPLQDINPALGGQVNYDVHGTAPYRRFVVSYYQVPMFSCTTLQFSEQVILYESSNIIETHILSKPLCPTWNAGASIHGLQVDSTIAFAVPGRNFPTQWTAFNDGYLFLPQGACAGTPPPSDTIQGRVYLDYNHNCIQDPGEFPIMNRPVVTNTGQFYGWTNTSGDYALGVSSGTHVVEQYNPSPYLFAANHCVPGGTRTVTTNGFNVGGADFPDSAGVVCPDLTVDFGSSSMRRCNNVSASMTYCNNGTDADTNVVITLTLNDSITITSSTSPITILGGNIYEFHVGGLLPGQCGTIGLVLDIGCDTAGTTYCINSSISGNAPFDCEPYDNAGVDCYQLVAAVDPNEKLVAAQDSSGYVRTDEMDVTDVLTYQINFQNVGTSYAEDVEIRDTLDATQLRIETLHAGAGSAPYNYIIIGNVVIFRFENIMLPDSTTDEVGSHGFVKFSIAQQPGNQPGTVIHNQAAIYFDLEAPVITNQTTNTIRTTDAISPALMQVAKVFPNPGRDQLVVECETDDSWQFTLYDLSGRRVMQTPLSSNRSVVPTDGLAPGMYLFHVSDGEKLLQAGKWLKE